MTKSWGQYRDKIVQLYEGERKPLWEVIDILKRDGFKASKRAYKYKLQQWGYLRYRPRTGCANPSIRRRSRAVLTESSPESTSRPADVDIDDVEVTPADESSAGTEVPQSPNSALAALPSFDITLPPTEPIKWCNIPDDKGRTPLHRAVYAGSITEVERCFESGAEVGLRDHKGNQPIHCLRLGLVRDIYHLWPYRTILGLLRAYGADINAKGAQGQTALHNATHSAVALTMLLELGAEPSVSNDSGATPLHMAVIESVLFFGRPPADSPLSILLKAGANTNAPSNDGCTPFHHLLLSPPGATIPQHEEFKARVREFVDNGADVVGLTGDGRSPLELLIWTHWDSRLDIGELVMLLLQKGADPNIRMHSGDLLIHDVLRRPFRYSFDDYAAVRRVCESANLDVQDDKGDYPLHCIARLVGTYSCMLECMSSLLDRGADADCCNSDGNTPLLLLLPQSPGEREDDDDITQAVLLLLNHGADRMRTNLVGDLPVYLAARYYISGGSNERLGILLSNMGKLSPHTLERTFHGSGAFWSNYALLYNHRTSWLGIASLVDTHRSLPGDIGEVILKTSIQILAVNAVGKITEQCSAPNSSVEQSLLRDRLTRILRDLRLRGINIRTDWYELLLELQDSPWQCIATGRYGPMLQLGT